MGKCSLVVFVAHIGTEVFQRPNPRFASLLAFSTYSFSAAFYDPLVILSRPCLDHSHPHTPAYNSNPRPPATARAVCCPTPSSCSSTRRWVHYYWTRASASGCAVCTAQRCLRRCRRMQTGQITHSRYVEFSHFVESDFWFCCLHCLCDRKHFQSNFISPLVQTRDIASCFNSFNSLSEYH